MPVDAIFQARAADRVGASEVVELEGRGIRKKKGTELFSTHGHVA
jgi:hypothetical protein